MSFELITPVFINDDFNRKLESSFLFCGVVKRLAELSNVQPVLRERRPHRRSWSSFPCCDMQSHYFFYFLCHSYSFLIWRESNSTGVSLPNIFTKTFTFP